MKKAVFFDIDNTIWDARNYIPESTKRAIGLLRKNGHPAFLNTGRTRGYIREPNLLAMDFDGIVSGCGTMIEYGGEVLMNRLIDPELALYTVETVRRCRFLPILEGPRYLYMDDIDFLRNDYADKVRRDMGDGLRTVSDHYGSWEINKLSCETDLDYADEFYETLSPYYHYLKHNEHVVEIVPLGFDKCTGMDYICSLLGIDRADTFAFGDSVNDLGMLEWAGCGIVMGNGSDAAKEAADYVTASLYDDGIEKALRRFDLI